MLGPALLLTPPIGGIFDSLQTPDKSPVINLQRISVSIPGFAVVSGCPVVSGWGKFFFL